MSEYRVYIGKVVEEIIDSPEKDQEFTRNEIKTKVSKAMKKDGKEPVDSSIIPTDHCYNRVDRRTNLTWPCFFLYLSRNKLKVVGVTFQYHGRIYAKPIEKEEEDIEDIEVGYYDNEKRARIITDKEYLAYMKSPSVNEGSNMENESANGKYTVNNFLAEVYMDEKKYDDITALLDRKKNIILQGAPGVGKSFLAKRLAYSIIGSKDKDKVEMVQFHQSYSYEDFIEGFRPGASGNFEIKQGVFYRFCKKAESDSVNKYFFIIDEINRGNLSKIMGELMLLLENDKRGEEFAMPLTYTGETFYVPENVYIIGMMNTADRSLAMIDYALRRRFSFIPIEPAFNNERFIKAFKANYHDAANIIEKMQKLNELIAEELDSGHQIGHSYFCSNRKLEKKDIKGIIEYEIKELLREYFFDKPEKFAEALSLL